MMGVGAAEQFLFLFRLPCVFRLVTGFYCPGCGGTRAVFALLNGKPILSFLYHPLVLYCAAVALRFFVSYALYWITKRPRYRRYLDQKYVNVGIVLTAANFLIKNYFLAAKGIDLLEMLPGWR